MFAAEPETGAVRTSPQWPRIDRTVRDFCIDQDKKGIWISFETHSPRTEQTTTSLAWHSQYATREHYTLPSTFLVNSEL